MFFMIVLSNFPMCVLDMDVNGPHDRAVMVSSVYSRYGR